jgi:hypothetical protein
MGFANTIFGGSGVLRPHAVPPSIAVKQMKKRNFDMGVLYLK